MAEIRPKLVELNTTLVDSGPSCPVLSKLFEPGRIRSQNSSHDFDDAVPSSAEIRSQIGRMRPDYGRLWAKFG